MYFLKYGDSYCVGKDKKTPYTRKDFLSAGTYSLQIPSDVTEVLVTGCGGGAGGLTVAHYNNRGNAGLSATAGSGGNSSFGSFSIQGGIGATCNDLNITNVPIFSDPVFTGTYSQGAVAEPNGKLGGIRRECNVDFDIAGATGFAPTFDGSAGGYGQGGNTHHFYDSDGFAAQVGAGGNSGAYVSRQKVSVTPNSVVTVIVGAGGTGVVNQTDGEAWRYTVTNGTQGFIIVEYGEGSTFFFPFLNI